MAAQSQMPGPDNRGDSNLDQSLKITSQILSKQTPTTAPAVDAEAVKARVTGRGKQHDARCNTSTVPSLAPQPAVRRSQRVLDKQNEATHQDSLTLTSKAQSVKTSGPAKNTRAPPSPTRDDDKRLGQEQALASTLSNKRKPLTDVSSSRINARQKPLNERYMDSPPSATVDPQYLLPRLNGGPPKKRRHADIDNASTRTSGPETHTGQQRQFGDLSAERGNQSKTSGSALWHQQDKLANTTGPPPRRGYPKQAIRGETTSSSRAENATHSRQVAPSGGKRRKVAGPGKGRKQGAANVFDLDAD